MVSLVDSLWLAFNVNFVQIQSYLYADCSHLNQTQLWSVREITKSSSTFSATNISNNVVWLLQLHDTIQMESNFCHQIQ